MYPSPLWHPDKLTTTAYSILYTIHYYQIYIFSREKRYFGIIQWEGLNSLERISLDLPNPSLMAIGGTGPISIYHLKSLDSFLHNNGDIIYILAVFLGSTFLEKSTKTTSRLCRKVSSVSLYYSQQPSKQSHALNIVCVMLFKKVYSAPKSAKNCNLFASKTRIKNF